MAGRFVAVLAACAVSALAVSSFASGASAQVYYGRSAISTPYGYPVPYGFLQPNETLGTSPSFVISTNPYAPGVGVVQRCQYPDGWNVTDFGRDVNGIPNGVDHTCKPPFARRLAY